ncbi:MAG: hypothetical protein GYB66_09445 [Chloroflexi bacterium]|nr:hypothetical protein [Chloroflexota bacterium]
MTYENASRQANKMPADSAIDPPGGLSASELATLALVCDTLIPSLAVDGDQQAFFQRRAHDLGIAHYLADTLSTQVEAGQLRELRLFLNVIEQPLLNSLLSRINRPFAAMSMAERTSLLQSWATSRLNLRRKAVQAIKRLALFYFYSLTDENNQNPNWAELDYQVPSQPATDNPEPVINPLEITEDTTLSADVVVIGSGAGGGVVAGELSAAGLDVIVLEKGSFYRRREYDSLELPSTARMFEKRGLLTTDDLSMTILAGSTLGGGTTVNWSATFRTPDSVLAEWEEQYGVTGFTGETYQQAMDAVSQRIQAGTEYSIPNRQNEMLEEGAHRLGYQVKTIPRNVDNCARPECGFCNFGCLSGGKQGTVATYLSDAAKKGARIITQAEVEHIHIAYGRATGVQACVTSHDEHQHQLIVHADTIVVAAGSIHTPAILRRSGLGNIHIGRNLHLHPTTVVFATYEEPVRGWEGPILTRYVDQFHNLDGYGYGVRLETAPVHPGIGASAIPWSSGLQHKQQMAQLAYMANTIIITRDEEGGQIKLNRKGQPRIRYAMAVSDARHMQRGLLASVRIHAAAGAREIHGPFTVPLSWDPEHSDLETYINTLETRPLLPNSLSLFSAHQMSSCRMGGSPAQGALNPTGETYEIQGLYVADGSALPSATGVNPMLSIMSVAYMIAAYIKARH